MLVTNISNSGLSMTADLSPYWVGEIAANTTWNDTVRVGGDVTVPAGVTLTIAANTVIQFIADTDAAGGGTDTGLSELIVQGTLTASAVGITFRSANDNATDADWYGIVVNGGSANLSGANIRDVKLCSVSNTGGTVTLPSNNIFSNCPGEVALEPTSPRVGQAVTATLTDADGYLAGSVWTWESRTVGGKTWTALSGSKDTTASSVYTPKATDLGKQLRAQVSYRDGHGTNTDTAESAVSAAVIGNQAPVLTGTAAVSYAEHDTVDVGSYTASDPDGHTIEWLALAGSDASHFTLTGTNTAATRALRFKQAPDYEKKNTYRVALKVKDKPSGAIGTAENPNASLTTTLAVQVTVTNVDEAGTLALSPLPPRAHRAITATLTDPDSVVTIQRWRWLPYAPGFGGIGATEEATAAATEAATEATAAAATVSSGHTSTYTPNIFFHKANLQLEVTASYTDGHKAGKQQRVLTAAVGPPDRAGTIALTTTAPEVGTAVTATLTDGDGSITGASWQWQRRKSSSGSWQDVSSASASAEAATYPEVSSYDPASRGCRLPSCGRRWSYRDGYAPNRRVEGTATSAVVDVPDAPGSPKATAGDKQVVLTWTTPANNGSALTGYAYRDSTVGANKKWSAWQDITGSGATTTTHTVTGLTNNTAYWFQVRAKNGVGAGAASDTVSATPGSAQAADDHGSVAAVVCRK